MGIEIKEQLRELDDDARRFSYSVVESQMDNLVSHLATISVDCRVPPGHGEETAIKRIREVLGGDGYRLEWTEQVVGNSSPVDSPLMDVVKAWLGEQEPEAQVLPSILPGFTDSRTWRATFPECVAYGFFPHRHMTLYEAAPLIHSADERIDVRDLGFATSFFRDVTTDLLG